MGSDTLDVSRLPASSTVMYYIAYPFLPAARAPAGAGRPPAPAPPALFLTQRRKAAKVQRDQMVWYLCPHHLRHALAGRAPRLAAPQRDVHLRPPAARVCTTTRVVTMGCCQAGCPLVPSRIQHRFCSLHRTTGWQEQEQHSPGQQQGSDQPQRAEPLRKEQPGQHRRSQWLQ